MSLTQIPRLIATEIAATPQQVTAAMELLDGGATVPFIARYRKEVTGGLDDTQLRKLEERLRNPLKRWKPPAKALRFTYRRHPRWS